MTAVLAVVCSVAPILNTAAHKPDVCTHNSATMKYIVVGRRNTATLKVERSREFGWMVLSAVDQVERARHIDIKSEKTKKKT